MLKHIDDIRKSARERATRKWKNHQVEQNFKTARKEAGSVPKESEDPQPADVLEGNQDRRGSLVRAQTKFAKDIRAMMKGHSQRAVALYMVSLEAKRKCLLVEKLRRLRLAQQESPNV